MDPRTDPAYVKLLEGTLASQNKRIADLERSNAAPAPVAPPKPVKTKDELRQEFYDNPIEASRSVIREELEATVRPLLEFVNQTKGSSRIDQLVTQFKNDPRFSSHWSPAIEQYVREQASAINPEALTESSFGFVVVSALGLKAAGMIQDTTSASPAPSPQTRQPEPTVPSPTYMRPSAPSGPGPSTQQPKHRALDENEKRLLREYNAAKSPANQMTEAQFIQWQEMPSSAVAFTTFDKPEKK